VTLLTADWSMFGLRPRTLVWNTCPGPVSRGAYNSLYIFYVLEMVYIKRFWRWKMDLWRWNESTQQL